ncbi:winged-helix domain-containing protein [Pseudonocardia sp. H11422]|uniref:winged helix-turn-helix transcriptional regulator n=1 Tax=Pseudonocardia sp. H11422 TaxID=2835866 RepID=UPI001BDD9DBA|nr:winged helix-turn-helix domain-containing protein [Pseudonocardia sp. H11422]
MSVTAWESDNSQSHARRRACLAAGAAQPARVAVLVVDTEDIARDLGRALAGQPVELERASDPAHGLLLVGRLCPDAVLLGPGAGRLDPLSFLEVVHAGEPDLPVIVGVGPGDAALAAGAVVLGAAVLAHPYRADQLLRLLPSLVPAQRTIEIRPLTLDLGRLTIDGAAPQMCLDGVTTRLPMREYLLLRYLAERVGAVVSRKEAVRAIWGVDGVRGSNTLTVHVMRLRRRLHDDEDNPQWIQAIRGLGYQFTVPSSSPGRGDT